MKKQIEAGCKAKIINSHAGNGGKIVTVIELLGKYGDCDCVGQYGPRWRIDRRVPTNTRDTVDHLGEGQLERIDYDGNEKVSWDSMKDIWIPNNNVMA